VKGLGWGRACSIWPCGTPEIAREGIALEDRHAEESVASSESCMLTRVKLWGGHSLAELCLALVTLEDIKKKEKPVDRHFRREGVQQGDEIFRFGGRGGFFKPLRGMNQNIQSPRRTTARKRSALSNQQRA